MRSGEGPLACRRASNLNDIPGELVADLLEMNNFAPTSPFRSAGDPRRSLGSSRTYEGVSSSLRLMERSVLKLDFKSSLEKILPITSKLMMLIYLVLCTTIVLFNMPNVNMNSLSVQDILSALILIPNNLSDTVNFLSNALRATRLPHHSSKVFKPLLRICIELATAMISFW